MSVQRCTEEGTILIQWNGILRMSEMSNHTVVSFVKSNYFQETQMSFLVNDTISLLLSIAVYSPEFRQPECYFHLLV